MENGKAGSLSMHFTLGLNTLLVNQDRSGFSCDSLSTKCLEFKANEEVMSIYETDVLSLAFSWQPATPPEDTPELSAFLRNSTIPHLVRRRDVGVLEPHRQSPAKILVSWLSQRAQIREERLDWPELPNTDGLNLTIVSMLRYACRVLAVHVMSRESNSSMQTKEYLHYSVFTLLNLPCRPR